MGVQWYTIPTLLNFFIFHIDIAIVSPIISDLIEHHNQTTVTTEFLLSYICNVESF
jgi:hypothetical protein